MRNRFACALILLAATAAARAQEGAIAGEVRDAGSGLPIAGAAVTLEAGSFRAATVSGPHGAFRFEHLAPDTYSVRCTMAGYAGSEVKGAFHQLEVKAGETRDRIGIDLMPIATLEGIVLDEEGKPMAGVAIYTEFNLRGETDAEGRFRIENLSTGKYQLLFRVPVETRIKTLKRDPKTGDYFGYAGTEFYPGTADPRASVPVDINGGANLRGFEIRLRRVPLVALGGRLVELAGGKPVADADVELIPTSGQAYDVAFRRRAVGPGARFRFDMLPPGSYSLLVYRGHAELPYAVRIEAGRKESEALTVAVPAQVKIAGTIRAPEGVEWTGAVIVSVSPMQRGAPSRVVTATGPEFAVDDLPPGDYRIQVDSRVTRKSDGRTLVVGSARMGATDLHTGIATIAESGTQPVEIQLTSETGAILGTAVGADGAPLRYATVLARRAETLGSRVVRKAAFIGGDGKFSFEDLAPGTYELTLAVEGNNSTAMKLPTERAEVRSGETTAVHLRVEGN